MPGRGRPPLSAEEIAARIRDYCARYGAQPGPEGVPPFPSGRRETPQHREWLALYKAHQRLRRRSAGNGSDPAR